MKLKSLSLGIVAALAISAAPAYAMTEVQSAALEQAIADMSGVSASEQVISLLTDCIDLGIGLTELECLDSTADIVAAVIDANPESAAEVVQAAVAIAPESTESIVAAAVTAAPGSAADIVAAAIAAGANADDVITAAVTAGADPTALTTDADTAPAAGTDTTRTLRSTSGSSISGN